MEREREGGKEDKTGWGGVGGSHMFTALTVPRQCSLFLVLK